MSRTDCALVSQSTTGFNEQVRVPVISALEYLDNHCIMCLLKGRASEGHGYDFCVYNDMHYGRDIAFVAFKQKFNAPKGFCYSCFLRQAQFPHDARNCPYRGHLLRLLFALESRAYSILDDYPNRPLKLLAGPQDSGDPNSVNRWVQWAISIAPGPSFRREELFINIYHLLLWTMTKCAVE
ncbi:hypothetical protein B0H34DRAFT_736715 [Crassisporium funariophilum]|nr:hypothetical protein B0H34DRAFT_736715 [Crassisporium funariophilum]